MIQAVLDIDPQGRAMMPQVYPAES
jgi:hypothetical protein